MIVVFSFSISTFLAVPRSLSVAFSIDRPISSEITVAPVSTAMSCSMALRRSPEARGLHAGHLQDAADVVHDQGRQGLALDVLGHDHQRTADFATCSSSGSISRMFEIFFSVRRISGFSSSATCVFWLLMKYGER